MKRIGTIAIVAIMACTAPAVAQSADSQAKPAEKKTCRRLTPTGSFMATRVCNTEAGWRQFDGITQQGVSDFRRSLNMSGTNERAGEK